MSKRLLLCLFLGLAAGAAQAQNQSGSGDSEPLIDGDAKAGAEKAAVCASCHGADGNSQNPVWPSLAGQSAAYIAHQLKLFKSGERDNAIMAGQAAGLSEQDMRNLGVYFAQQTAKPGVADESLVEAGAKIYHGGKPDDDVPACAGCHGPSGLGNPTAMYPRLAGQHAPYVASQLKAYRDGERKNYRTGAIMTGVSEGLSDEDIEALASYVSGLGPRNGK